MTTSNLKNPIHLIDSSASCVSDEMALHDKLYESLLKVQALVKVLSCSRFSEGFSDEILENYINAVLDVIDSSLETYELLETLSKR